MTRKTAVMTRRILIVAVVAGALAAAPAAYALYTPVLSAPLDVGPAKPGASDSSPAIGVQLAPGARRDIVILYRRERRMLRFPNTGVGFGPPQSRTLPAAADSAYRLVPVYFPPNGAIESRGVVSTGIGDAGLFSVLASGGGLVPGPAQAGFINSSSAITNLSLGASKPYAGIVRVRAGAIDRIPAAEGGVPAFGAATSTAVPALKGPQVAEYRQVATGPAGSGPDLAFLDGGLRILRVAFRGSSGSVFKDPVLVSVDLFNSTYELAVAPDATVAKRARIATAERFPYPDKDGQIGLFAASGKSLVLLESILLPAKPHDVEWTDANADGRADVVAQANGTWVFLNDGDKGFVPMAGSPFRTPGDTMPNGADVEVADVLGSPAEELIVTSGQGSGPSRTGISILGLTGLVPPKVPCQMIAILTGSASVSSGGRIVPLTGGTASRRLGTIPCDATAKTGSGEVVLAQSADTVKAANPRERKKLTLKGGTFKLKRVTTRSRRYTYVSLAGKKGRCGGTRAKLSVTGAGRFVIKGRRATVALGSKRATVRVTDSCSGKTAVKVARGIVSVKPRNGKAVTLRRGGRLTR